MKRAVILTSIFVLLASLVHAATYEHDRFNTQPKDIVREFKAFISSFDSLDDNNDDGVGDALGVPEWVSYEIKHYDGECIPTKDRPSWFTDDELFKQGIAPKDDSYKYSRKWRKEHPDWYVRGHLCMKFIAERVSNEAAYNTHTMLNAVPQRDTFNSDIWEDLEQLTADWAQRYGRVWVITGPIFVDGAPVSFIGEKDKGEFQVAVPEALFKIVVKENGTPEPDVLSFIYPQVGAGYTLSDYDHTRFLTSVDEIEELTGLNFLTSLPHQVEKAVEKKIAKSLWESSKGDRIPACRKKVSIKSISPRHSAGGF